MKYIKIFENFSGSTSIIRRKIPITGFIHDHFAVPTHWLENDTRVTLYDGSYWRSISTKNVEVIEVLDTTDDKIVKRKLNEYREKEKEELKKDFPWIYKDKFPRG